MGTNYYMVKTKPTLLEPLHIGKNSWGWKFLFHSVDSWEYEVRLNSYEDWKRFIYTEVEAGNFVILDEYERQLEPDELFEIIDSAQKNENPDNFRYNENIDGYRFWDRDFS